MAFEFEKELKVEKTNIPGLLVFDLPVHGDNRGWFKENWQRAVGQVHQHRGRRDLRRVG